MGLVLGPFEQVGWYFWAKIVLKAIPVGPHFIHGPIELPPRPHCNDLIFFIFFDPPGAHTTPWPESSVGPWKTIEFGQNSAKELRKTSVDHLRWSKTG